MSYEAEMLQKLAMPSRENVEKTLLVTLFNHSGAVKEFGAGEEIVEEVADNFELSEEQRNAYLETVYRKENRVKKSNLWHRLLFRAADNLAKQKLISRPTETVQLTERREWMLTEEGYDQALDIANIPISDKGRLSIKSFEVEKLAKQLIKKNKPHNYSPIEQKVRKPMTKTSSLRKRSFRQAIIEAYDFKCAVCGLKICSPKTYQWEVEAAHIVPHSYNGKDDVWNGVSLCRLHHWAFDVGWYSIDQEWQVVVSRYLDALPNDMGRAWNFRLMEGLLNSTKVQLPKEEGLWPDLRAIQWHRENILQKNK